MDYKDHVWIAAYSAYFAAEFNSTNRRVGFDRATELTSAETAMDVADIAVSKLERWIEQEGHTEATSRLRNAGGPDD